jgi:hypothetical protein
MYISISGLLAIDLHPHNKSISRVRGHQSSALSVPLSFGESHQKMSH